MSRYATLQFFYSFLKSYVGKHIFISILLYSTIYNYDYHFKFRCFKSFIDFMKFIFTNKLIAKFYANSACTYLVNFICLNFHTLIQLNPEIYLTANLFPIFEIFNNNFPIYIRKVGIFPHAILSNLRNKVDTFIFMCILCVCNTSNGLFFSPVLKKGSIKFKLDKIQIMRLHREI